MKNLSNQIYNLFYNSLPKGIVSIIALAIVWKFGDGISLKELLTFLLIVSSIYGIKKYPKYLFMIWKWMGYIVIAIAFCYNIYNIFFEKGEAIDLVQILITGLCFLLVNHLIIILKNKLIELELDYKQFFINLISGFFIIVFINNYFFYTHISRSADKETQKYEKIIHNFINQIEDKDNINDTIDKIDNLLDGIKFPYYVDSIQIDFSPESDRIIQKNYESKDHTYLAKIIINPFEEKSETITVSDPLFFIGVPISVINSMFFSIQEIIYYIICNDEERNIIEFIAKYPFNRSSPAMLYAFLTLLIASIILRIREQLDKEFEEQKISLEENHNIKIDQLKKKNEKSKLKRRQKFQEVKEEIQKLKNENHENKNQEILEKLAKREDDNESKIKEQEEEIIKLKNQLYLKDIQNLNKKNIKTVKEILNNIKVNQNKIPKPSPKHADEGYVITVWKTLKDSDMKPYIKDIIDAPFQGQQSNRILTAKKELNTKVDTFYIEIINPKAGSKGASVKINLRSSNITETLILLLKMSQINHYKGYRLLNRIE